MSTSAACVLSVLLHLTSLQVFGTPWINITQGPEDTYVTVGDVVPCYCIYNGTDDFPTWRINNISHSPNALPPGHIVNKTGIFFQAFPETNQSTYQCQFSYYNNSSKSFEKLQSDTGRVHVQGGNMSSDDLPSPECNTTFVAAVIESPSIQLQWDPVNTSDSWCQDNVTYCVSYRCCNDANWKQTSCTQHTSIKFQVNLEGCEVENQAVFSVQVEGSECIDNLTVNLDNNTEFIVDKVGAVIQIEAQSCTCDTFGEFCIAPNGSNTVCYKEEIPQEINNYTLTVCKKRPCTISRPCLQTNVTEAMNNTIYTGFCFRERCNSIPIVGATSKLIVAAPPSQPERPCLYYNGTHIVLCAELPFSHLLITAFNISLTTTVNQHFIVTTNLCEPIPVCDMVNMTDDCQLVNVSITAISDAGESQPSPPATVNKNETDFCSCVGQRLPRGYATHVSENGSLAEFEIQQPTSPLPPNLIMNFCNGSLGITIMPAIGENKTIQKMWNLELCDFKHGQARINLSVDSFPRPTAGQNYTVIFNVSFYIDGVVDLCYLQMEVDNVTVADKGGVNIALVVGLTVGLPVGILLLRIIPGCIIGIIVRLRKKMKGNFQPKRLQNGNTSRDDSSLSQDDSSPTQGASSPPQNGSSPPQNGSSPPQNGSSPPQNGSSPPQNGSNPTQESQELGDVASYTNAQ